MFMCWARFGVLGFKASHQPPPNNLTKRMAAPPRAWLPYPRRPWSHPAPPISPGRFVHGGANVLCALKLQGCVARDLLPCMIAVQCSSCSGVMTMRGVQVRNVWASWCESVWVIEVPSCERSCSTSPPFYLPLPCSRLACPASAAAPRATTASPSPSARSPSSQGDLLRGAPRPREGDPPRQPPAGRAAPEPGPAVPPRCRWEEASACCTACRYVCCTTSSLTM